jgi:hypothetical protein
MNRRKARLVPPVILIVLLTWLMVGCVYIPWFEQKNNSKQLDFRPLIGPADSNRPVRVGHVTREQTIDVLGEPITESADGRVLVYGINSFYGYWIAPFCFSGATGFQKGTVVRLQFDRNGILERYDTATSSALFRLTEWDGMYQQEAARKLDQRGLPTPFNPYGPNVRPFFMPATEPAGAFRPNQPKPKLVPATTAPRAE